MHGTSAIVALTAQNTHEVISVETLPRQFILDQVRAVVEDMGVDAVKIGMLFDEPTIDAVDGGPRPGRRGARRASTR